MMLPSPRERVHFRRRSGARVKLEQDPLPARLEAVAQQHPKRRVLQFLAPRLEYLFSRVRAVVVFQLFEPVYVSGISTGMT